jgi:hypothetical protein
MKETQTNGGDTAARRCESAGSPEGRDEAHQELHGDVEAPAPEEAGYGYGV